MSREQPGAQSSLRGHLTAFQIFTLALGAMIGVGWIPLLGQWIGAAGPVGAALAFVFGGLVIALIAQAYIQVARRLPVTGGEVAFAYGSLGRRLGFITGWAIAYTYVAVCVFEAISIGWILGEILPWIEGPVL